MGMTIDDVTLYMELYKRKLFNSVSDLDKDIEAYDTAIETMRKYQKIEEIVNSNPDNIHYTDMDTYKVNSIREVLENGNDD